VQCVVWILLQARHCSLNNTTQYIKEQITRTITKNQTREVKNNSQRAQAGKDGNENRKGRIGRWARGWLPKERKKRIEQNRQRRRGPLARAKRELRSEWSCFFWGRTVRRTRNMKAGCFWRGVGGGFFIGQSIKRWHNAISLSLHIDYEDNPIKPLAPITALCYGY